MSRNGMSHTPRDPSQLSELSLFVREVATQTSAQSDYTIGRLTIILGRYVDWAHRICGLALVPGLLFNRQVIDLYVRDALSEQRLSKSSVAAYRSVLARVAEIYLPVHDALQPTAIAARPITAPYSMEELRGATVWRRAQRTPLMRRKATALLALGLGGGLRAREILALRRLHVDIDGASEVTVTVWSGETTREVPMLGRWVRPFTELIEDLDADDFVFGDPRRQQTNPNAIGSFIASASPGFAMSTYRMRSTWIVGRLAAGVDVRTLLVAAGLERLEKLDEYVPYLPEPDDRSFNRLRAEVSR